MIYPSQLFSGFVCPLFPSTLWHRYDKPRAMAVISGRAAKAVLPILMLFAAALCTQAQQLNVGDVIVATTGKYQVTDHTNGTVKANLAAPNGDQTAGCAFDSTWRMRGAITTENEVVKYPIGSPFAFIPSQTATTETTTHPLGIVFDGDNKFYVGHPDGKIELFNASGSPITSFSVGEFIDDIETPQFFSLDIRQDGKTLDFTSGGPHIGVFNTTSNSTTQISVTNQATITSFSITGNVVTFQATNNFEAGTSVTITGLTTTAGMNLDNQVLTVLSTGLSASQFEANFTSPDVASTMDSGTASADYILYGIRELSPFNGSGGYVAAIGLDIANISSTGAVNFFYVKGVDGGSNNWETLALDPDGTHFWATNLATGNLYEFNLTGGPAAAGPFETAASTENGQGGVCVVGGFSAAQPAPIVETVMLSPGSNSNTFTFTSPGTTQVSLGNGVTGTSTKTNTLNESMVFKAGATGPVTVTAWFIEIDSSVTSPVGTSDPANGSLPCLVTDMPSGNRCGVVKVEFSPDSATVFSSVNISLFTDESSTSPVYVSDENKSVTTFIAHGSSIVGGCHCSTVYSLHEQTLSPPTGGEVSCGYQTPVTTSPLSPSGNTLPLKFSTAVSAADCRAKNYLNSSSLLPTVSLVMLAQSGLTLTGTQEFVSTAGNSVGYRFSPPSTWIFNINMSSFPKGCYIATTFDASNQIGSFSYSATTNPATVLISNGSHQCNGIILP
jgi:hypothetical protein